MQARSDENKRKLVFLDVDGVILPHDGQTAIDVYGQDYPLLTMNLNTLDDIALGQPDNVKENAIGNQIELYEKFLKVHPDFIALEEAIQFVIAAIINNPDNPFIFHILSMNHAAYIRTALLANCIRLHGKNANAYKILQERLMKTDMDTFNPVAKDCQDVLIHDRKRIETKLKEFKNNLEFTRHQDDKGRLMKGHYAEWYIFANRLENLEITHIDDDQEQIASMQLCRHIPGNIIVNPIHVTEDLAFTSVSAQPSELLARLTEELGLTIVPKPEIHNQQLSVPDFSNKPEQQDQQDQLEQQDVNPALQPTLSHTFEQCTYQADGLSDQSQSEIKFDSTKLMRCYMRNFNQFDVDNDDEPTNQLPNDPRLSLYQVKAPTRKEINSAYRLEMKETELSVMQREEDPLATSEMSGAFVTDMQQMPDASSGMDMQQESSKLSTSSTMTLLTTSVSSLSIFSTNNQDDQTLMPATSSKDDTKQTKNAKHNIKNKDKSAHNSNNARRKRRH